MDSIRGFVRLHDLNALNVFCALLSPPNQHATDYGRLPSSVLGIRGAWPWGRG